MWQMDDLSFNRNGVMSGRGNKAVLSAGLVLQNYLQFTSSEHTDCTRPMRKRNISGNAKGLPTSENPASFLGRTPLGLQRDWDPPENPRMDD